MVTNDLVGLGRATDWLRYHQIAQEAPGRPLRRFSRSGSTKGVSGALGGFSSTPPWCACGLPGHEHHWGQFGQGSRAAYLPTLGVVHPQSFQLSQYPYQST